MNPEIRQKIEKMMKSGGMEELNLDNMANVSGGGADTVRVFGNEMSKAEFNDMMMGMVKGYGYQAAASFLTEVTGHVTGNWRIEKRILTAVPDEYNMEKELEDFWERRARGIK